MLVTRLELENIKSYEQREFAFERGTTAIVGRNGAGKTTILEAIAWALFDNLEYSKDDFLRRGAKKGSVRVTFESGHDQRQYVVYRDTANGYHIFDPVLNLRLAEKKIDALNFLRQHLGIEPGTDLKSLFRSAIGVPQGTFTAEFTLTATARKAAFDRLLKVEEYREGAERLRETNSLIRERVTAVRERIAGAEGQLARYDELVAQYDAARAQERESSVALEQFQRETAEHAARVAAFDEAERLVTAARADADRLTARREAAESQARLARRELDAAARAADRRRQTEGDYRRHLDARQALREMEGERAERDAGRVEEQRVASMLAMARADVKRLEENLARAGQARASADQLQTSIAEQEALERERERLRELRARSAAARQACVSLDKDLETLRTQHAQTKERVRVAEAARGAQDAVDKLESERLHIENELSRERELATSRKHVGTQHRDLEREVQRVRSVVAALDRDVRAYAELTESAPPMNGLESREQYLSELIARLRAEIARDEKMRAEVRGGLCPILSQKCLNVGPGQTLEGYFQDQLAANQTNLAEVEGERAQLAQAMRAAREAQLAASKLEAAQARLAQEKLLLGERESTLATITSDLEKMSANGGGDRLREMQLKQFGIDAELKTARDAAQLFAELKTQQARLREITEEGKRKKEERAELAAAAEAFATLGAEAEEVEQRLRALGDPRARARTLLAEAEREQSIEIELRGARDAARSLEDDRNVLRERLLRFAALDARWAEATAERDRTNQAYEEYLACAAAAGALEEREKEFARSEGEVARLSAESRHADEIYEAAAIAYDRARHQTARDELALARERAAVTSARLAAARETVAARGAEIDRLNEIRVAMREEFAEKDRLERLNEATDFIRDTLKAAGPLVTESYLYNISVEANQLFRDITGEAGRTLRWSRDYEIILEEDGYERSFANLSGGEQMVAAVSVRLALLKQLSDVRIAFFDEPTVNMDDERRERLALSIGQMRNFDQLFVISHDDTFEESVDHVIHISGKDEGRGMKDES